MRRQLADQQRRERALEHQQDSSQQQLKETATKIKWQAAAVRGGYNYQEFRRPRPGRTKKANKKESEESSPYKLPSVKNTKTKHQKKLRYGNAYMHYTCAGHVIILILAIFLLLYIEHIKGNHVSLSQHYLRLASYTPMEKAQYSIKISPISPRLGKRICQNSLFPRLSYNLWHVSEMMKWQSRFCSGWRCRESCRTLR